MRGQRVDAGGQARLLGGVDPFPIDAGGDPPRATGGCAPTCRGCDATTTRSGGRRRESCVQDMFTLAVIMAAYGTAATGVLRGGRRRGTLHPRRRAAARRPARRQPADPAAGVATRRAAVVPRPAHGRADPGGRGAAAPRARRTGAGPARPTGRGGTTWVGHRRTPRRPGHATAGSPRHPRSARSGASTPASR